MSASESVIVCACQSALALRETVNLRWVKHSAWVGWMHVWMDE